MFAATNSTALRKNPKIKIFFLIGSAFLLGRLFSLLILSFPFVDLYLWDAEYLLKRLLKAAKRIARFFNVRLWWSWHGLTILQLRLWWNFYDNYQTAEVDRDN